MTKQSYRIVAPHRPRAVAAAKLRGMSNPGGLMWLVAGLLALGLALATSGAHAQARLAAGPGPSTSDYVRQSALTDLFEITSSRVALDRSQNPEVRDFAQQMMSDHGRSTGELKRALKDGKVLMTVPTSLDPQQQQEIKALQEKPADQFDQAYLQSQLQGHRTALDMQRAYAQSGGNAALRRYAIQATPMVQRHLARLEVLAQNSFAARMCQAPAASAHPYG